MTEPPNTWDRHPRNWKLQRFQMPKNEAKKHICSAAPGLARFVGLVGPSTGGSPVDSSFSFKDFSRLKNVSLLRDIGHFEQNCSPVKTVENNKTLNLLK